VTPQQVHIVRGEIILSGQGWLMLAARFGYEIDVIVASDRAMGYIYRDNTFIGTVMRTDEEYFAQRERPPSREVWSSYREGLMKAYVIEQLMRTYAREVIRAANPNDDVSDPPN
jgi:hypothetical protein